MGLAHTRLGDLTLTRREAPSIDDMTEGRTGGTLVDAVWTVGQVADELGVTVRTLHHYDEIGLLRPGERTPAGYRLYTADRPDPAPAHRRLPPARVPAGGDHRPARREPGDLRPTCAASARRSARRTSSATDHGHRPSPGEGDVRACS